jgi:hypothetical protein
MTKNGKELVELICENDNPEQAVRVAIETILSFLEQHESYQAPMVVAPLGQA